MEHLERATPHGRRQRWRECVGCERETWVEIPKEVCVACLAATRRSLLDKRHAFRESTHQGRHVPKYAEYALQEEQGFRAESEDGKRPPPDDDAPIRWNKKNYYRPGARLPPDE